MVIGKKAKQISEETLKIIFLDIVFVMILVKENGKKKKVVNG